MALQKSFTGRAFNTDVVVSDCYYKITNMQGNKESLSFDVSISKDDSLVSSIQYSFVPSVDEGSANYTKQAYEYLKTLPEFADATDC